MAARSIGLILGGARSGKSRFAESLACRLAPRPVYLATSRRWDDDHAARIERHRRDRSPQFDTVEQEKVISRVGRGDRIVVVDCVTLWLTNFFADSKQDAEAALVEARREFDAAVALPNTWLFVSNELGQGLHAPSEVGRKFTDLQGFMNQYIAQRADWVVLMVAGLPLNVKGQPPLAGDGVVP